MNDSILIKNLAHTAEIINTINGGMAEPVLKINKQGREWMVTLRIPGVNIENIKIEVKDNQLLVFHLINESNNSNIQLPHLVTALTISNKIDLDGIVAQYENGQIFIHLPLNEQATGYEREIEIFKK